MPTSTTTHSPFKQILIAIVAILLLLFFYKAFIPKYNFLYYRSKKTPQVLTRVTYPNAWLFNNDTYLTPGHYSIYKIPKVYIKPTYSLDGDWAMYVTFHSKGIAITGTAEARNTSDSFTFFEGSVDNYNVVITNDSVRKTYVDVEEIALYSFDK
jgi:hypothetical protein